MTTTATDGRLASALARARRRALAPPPLLAVDQWADRYRRVPAGKGAFAGPWSTGRFEIARGPMRALTEPGVRTVVVMAATQTLKTSVAECAVGYYAHLDPCPVLFVEPTEADARKLAREKINPMFLSSPVLRERTEAWDEDEQTIFERRFTGGQVLMTFASSDNNLSMLPWRIVVLDEIDKMTSTAMGADPVALALDRTTTFGDMGRSILTCSPEVEGESRIESWWLEGDQRKPFVCCPHCGEWQVMEWGGRDTPHGVRWRRGDDGEHDPSTAGYACRGCGALWTEAERRRVLRTIQWRQTRRFSCCGEEQDPELWELHLEGRAEPVMSDEWDGHLEPHQHSVGYACCRHCRQRAVRRPVASFWASKLYNPVQSMASMVSAWLGAAGNPEALKAFWNTTLGLPWPGDVQRADAHDLVVRRETYAAEVPAPVRVLTAGVDTQDDRLECETVGWGPGSESWSIDYTVLNGDPQQPEVWRKLEDLLARRWQREDGRALVVQAAAVDSGGHATEQVYAFSRRNRNRRWWAVKGLNETAASPQPIWPRRPTYRTRGSTPLYMIGTQTAKSTHMGRLRIDQPGPGYCHFPARPEYGAEHFEQLAAYRRQLKRGAGGRTFSVWADPPKGRCEAADCRVYAIAALAGLQQLAPELLDRELAVKSPPPPAAENSCDDQSTAPNPRSEPVKRPAPQTRFGVIRRP